MSDIIRLCDSDNLGEGESRGFEPAEQTGTVFVVRRGGQVYGYRNSCPHTGIELNFAPDQFLDVDGDLIQCSMHGALFRIEDGLCLRGPCRGDSLAAVTVTEHDGGIWLEPEH